MKTSSNYSLKESVRLFVLQSLFILLFVPITFAQSVKYKPSKATYIGIEGGFGARSFTLDSDIPQLDELYTAKAGWSLGIIYGSQIIKVPLVLGSYSMSIEEKRTIDLLTLQLGTNISLLRLFGVKKSPIEIYALSNIEVQRFMFAGSYLKLPEDEPIKKFYGERILGNIIMLNANIGVGVEFKIMDKYDFVHLFVETKKSYLIANSATKFFNKTNISNGLVVNIGLRVGTIR